MIAGIAFWMHYLFSRRCTELACPYALPHSRALAMAQRLLRAQASKAVILTHTRAHATQLCPSRWQTGQERRKLNKELSAKLKVEPTQHRGARVDFVAALTLVYELLDPKSYDAAKKQVIQLALDGRKMRSNSQALLCFALKTVLSLSPNSPYGVVPLGIAEGIDRTDQKQKKNKKSDPENRQALIDNFGPVFDQIKAWRKAGSKIVLSNGTVLTFQLKGGFDLKTLTQLHGRCAAPPTKDATHEICCRCDVNARPKSKGAWHGHRNLTYERDMPDSLLRDVVDLDDIVVCCVHCKMRTTEHLHQRTGELAVVRGTFEPWLAAVREQVPSFWAWYTASDKQVNIPMQMGPAVEQYLRYIPCSDDPLASEPAFMPSLRALFGPSSRSRKKQAFSFNRLSPADKLLFKQYVDLFNGWRRVNAGMRNRAPTFGDGSEADKSDNAQLGRDGIAFANAYRHMFGAESVFTYLHYIACHIAEQQKLHGNLPDFSQQGPEHAHKLQRGYDVNTFNDGGCGKNKVKQDSRLAVLLKSFRVLTHALPTCHATRWGGKKPLADATDADAPADAADALDEADAEAIAAVDAEMAAEEEQAALAEFHAADDEADDEAVFHASDASVHRRSARVAGAGSKRARL